MHYLWIVAVTAINAIITLVHKLILQFNNNYL